MGRNIHAVTTVDFHGHQLFAFGDEHGTFVALKPIVAAIGLDWGAQYERLKRDPLLRSGRTMAVLPTLGGPQRCSCLRFDLLHGWLFTISGARLKPDVRDRVRVFQQGCYAALADALRRAGEAKATFASPLDLPSMPAVLAFGQREALAALNL